MQATICKVAPKAVSCSCGASHSFIDLSYSEAILLSSQSLGMGPRSCTVTCEGGGTSSVACCLAARVPTSEGSLHRAPRSLAIKQAQSLQSWECNQAGTLQNLLQRSN